MMNIGNYLQAICVLIIFVLAVYELTLGISQVMSQRVTWYKQADIFYGIGLLLLVALFVGYRITNNQLSGNMGIIVPIIFIVFCVVLLYFTIRARRKKREGKGDDE